MDTVRVDGIDLVYEVQGSGPPVVFVHGGLIADTFSPLLAAPPLASSIRSIHYHRRGYAGSGHDGGPISVARQVADCRALLDQLSVRRAHVVGHSSGGSIALQLALDAPDLVHSLVLLEPALILGENGPAYRASLAKAAEQFQVENATASADAFLEARWPGYRAPLDRLLPGAFPQAVADAATFFEGEVPGLVAWHFDEAQARRITQPTLSVLGGDSTALMPRFGETHAKLQAWLPNAEGAVIPGTTHMLQLQDPGAVADALAAFWSRHPIPAAAA